MAAGGEGGGVKGILEDAVDQNTRHNQDGGQSA